MSLYIPTRLELEPATGALECLALLILVPYQVFLRVPLGHSRFCTRRGRKEGSSACTGCILFEGLAHSRSGRLVNTNEDHHVSFSASKGLMAGGCACHHFRSPAGMTFLRLWHDSSSGAQVSRAISEGRLSILDAVSLLSRSTSVTSLRAHRYPSRSPAVLQAGTILFTWP